MLCPMPFAVVSILLIVGPLGMQRRIGLHSQEGHSQNRSHSQNHSHSQNRSHSQKHLAYFFQHMVGNVVVRRPL